MANTTQPKQQQAKRAAGKGDTLDDTPRAQPLYSPVCTYCREWGAHPDRWQYCTAWPHDKGVKIPQAIWNGTPGKVSGYYHTRHVNGDHGVVFHPDSAATRLPPKLKAAYEAAQKSSSGDDDESES